MHIADAHFNYANNFTHSALSGLSKVLKCAAQDYESRDKKRKNVKKCR